MMISRAQGCLLGQLIGDSLGGLVEFMTPGEISRLYPDGVRDLSDGGTWGTIAGQPTDDSEMALALARVLIERGTYDKDAVRKAYLDWLGSGPFDCGMTVRNGLRGSPNPESQANGALMRISPLGIFGANSDLGEVGEWARQDASLTHPNPVCREANALFAMAIANAIRSGNSPRTLYEEILNWANGMGVDGSLLEAITNAAVVPPADYIHQQGWVLIALQNALWQLLHAPNIEEGLVDTIMRGGDTDTNAATCGALLGAVYGVESIPRRWQEKILSCRPAAGAEGVRHPRPERYWPVDALVLAEKLVDSSG